MSETSNKVKEAYNEWAEVYDTNENRTRDLNAKTIRQESFSFKNKRILEIGCGTGLNTQYLIQQAGQVVGLDISEKMLSKARGRIHHKNTMFVQGDITKPWNFESESFDFIVANLVLEHIEQLSHAFTEANRVLTSGGTFYIGELHPYKQLRKSQAKFVSQKTGKVVLVDAFTHSVSEYINEGLQAGFTLHQIKEYQDKEDQIPRLLTLLFRK